MLKKFFSKKKAKYIVGAVIIIVGAYFVFAGGDKNTNKEETEKKIQSISLLVLDEHNNNQTSISAIGTIESQEQVELKSEISSTIKKINVKLGDEVRKGDVLIELDRSTLDAQLQQASASINRVQGNLQQQLAGATDETIEQSLASVKQAEANLAQAQAQLENTLISNQNRIENARLSLEQARTSLLNIEETANQNTDSVNDTVRSSLLSTTSTIKSLLVTLTTLQYQYFACFDSTFCTDVSFAKERAIAELYDIQNAGRYNSEAVSRLSGGLISQIENNSISENQFEQKLNKLIAGLNSLKTAYNKLLVASNSQFGTAVTVTDKASVTTSLATIDSTVSSLVAAKNSIDGAIIGNKTNKDNTQSQFEKAEENYSAVLKQTEEDETVARSLVEASKAGLEQAKAGYNGVISGPREVDLLGTKAGVREAQASYNLIAANRAKAFITAPFDGVISVLPVKRGELVSPGTRMIGIVNDGGLQVSAYINERDRALLQIGGEVMVEDSVSATITHIAPSIDPVTRKVRVIASLNKSDEETDTEQPILLIDQFVRAEFDVVDKNTDTIYLLPLSSIKTTTQGTYVYVTEKIEDKTQIKTIQVQVGRIIGESIEVFTGLESIDAIVASTQGLKDGQEVTVMQ